MIIFGWGHRRDKSFGAAEVNYCNHCHNETPWELNKTST